MSEFKEYRDTTVLQIRPYQKGEDLTGINVPEGIEPDKDKGFIAVDPTFPDNGWYIPKKDFKANFTEVVEAEVITDNADVLPYEFLSSGISNGMLVSNYALQLGRGVALMTIIESVGFVSNDIEFLPEASIRRNEDGTKSII